MAKLLVTQVKSAIGGKQNQRDTLRSLGLKRIGQTVERPDDDVTRGHGPSGGAPRHRRGGQVMADETEKVHVLKCTTCAPPRRQDREDPRGSRRGLEGQDRGRGHQGHQGPVPGPERFEGGQMPMHMRLPKLRGFKNPFRVEYQVVNLDKLAELFPEGGRVEVADLVRRAPSARDTS
jgi:large subunit ribosomal protein L15